MHFIVGSVFIVSVNMTFIIGFFMVFRFHSTINRYTMFIISSHEEPLKNVGSMLQRW